MMIEKHGLKIATELADFSGVLASTGPITGDFYFFCYFTI